MAPERIAADITVIRTLAKRGVQRTALNARIHAQVDLSMDAGPRSCARDQRGAVRGAGAHSPVPFHFPRLSAMIFVDCIAD